MASAHSFITDADLHGLVDGHLEADRRVDALRRLAASPADRARVEAWQRQTDLLRSAFAGIEHEPLPAALDLKTRPPLHCVPSGERAVAPPAVGAPPRRWPRFGSAFATLIVVAAALGGAWMFVDSDENDDPVADAKLRGSVVADLATRTSAAVTNSQATAGDPSADPLPTSRIPNLQPAGFAFVGADVGTAGPSSIVFRYRSGTSDRLVVSIARASGSAPEGAPARIGSAYGWQKHGTAYAIAGTVRPARLRAIAVALQNDGAN